MIELLAEDGTEQKGPAEVNATSCAEMWAVGALVGATHFADAQNIQIIVLPDLLLIVL